MWARGAVVGRHGTDAALCELELHRDEHRLNLLDSELLFLPVCDSANQQLEKLSGTR